MTSLVEEPLKDHDLHPPQAIHIEINVNNDDADVVAQTTFQLVEMICECFKDDQNAYCSIFDTPEKRLLVAQKIYNGIKRVKVLPDYVDDNTEILVDVLTNPDFCISDICKLRRVEITDVPNLIVNYLMVYSNFPDARDPEIYDGKSLQIGYRLETHQSITASDIRFQQSVHYQVANGSSEGIVGDTSSRPTSIFKDVLSNTEQTFGEVTIGGELSSLWVVVVMEIEHAVVDGLEQENCDLLGERNNIDVVVFQIATRQLHERTPCMLKFVTSTLTRSDAHIPSIKMHDNFEKEHVGHRERLFDTLSLGLALLSKIIVPFDSSSNDKL
ncbi:hypothetical protein D6C95_04813 [Aureobasidium pullulans]|nr:hypothetical protein D6C95_04813 [Aureobasidium pullulans]